VVRVLINSGADINKAKDGIWTPLFIAAQEGHEVIVRALIEMGVDVNKAGMAVAQHCISPLNRAARRWCLR